MPPSFLLAKLIGNTKGYSRYKGGMREREKRLSDFVGQGPSTTEKRVTCWLVGQGGEGASWKKRREKKIPQKKKRKKKKKVYKKNVGTLLSIKARICPLDN